MLRFEMVLCGLVIVMALCAGKRASAQESTTGGGSTAVEAKGAGIVGGAMAGAEVVLLVESIARVKPLWAWIAFPVAGAAGGGVGGYFLEKKSAGGAIALLITGMVATIPTAVAVASARSFDPVSAGAKSGDGAGGSKSFSFEQDPQYEEQPRAQEAVTEVEARPDGVPADQEGPPAPGSDEPVDQSTDEPVDQSTDEHGDDVDGASGARHMEGDTGDAYYRSVLADAGPSNDTRKRLAHLSSGALFHMNAGLGFGVGIPAVDVLPANVKRVHFEAPQGIHVNVPVLKIDLP